MVRYFTQKTLSYNFFWKKEKKVIFVLNMYSKVIFIRTSFCFFIQNCLPFFNVLYIGLDKYINMAGGEKIVKIHIKELTFFCH